MTNDVDIVLKQETSLSAIFFFCEKTSNNKKTADMNRITTHPGDVLKEELEARGISQKKFSEVLSIPYTQLNEILNAKRPVTTDFALMMEAALGI